MRIQIARFILGSVIIGIISLIVRGYMAKFDVKNNGNVTIGKYVSQDSWGKGEINYFIYHVNGKKLKANGGRAPKMFSTNIGKFYEIQYSSKYPNSIQANFNNEITDRNRILEAGFSSTDFEIP